MSTNPHMILRHQSLSGAQEIVSRAAIPGVVVMLLILGSLVSPRFLGMGNLVNILNAASIVAVVAVGMTMVLLVGGLVDLSVPGTLATGGIVTLLAGSTLPVPLAVLAGVVAAAVAGGVNGVLIGHLELNPIVTTLGTSVIILGVAQTFVSGRIIYSPFPEETKASVTGSYLGLPFAVWVAIVVATIATIVLTRTAIGRRIYSIGGNRNAALVAGVRTRLITAMVFVVSAACAGLAGAILALQLGSVRPEIGSGYEFGAVTAVVIGGTSLFGGAGSVTKTLGGLMIVAVTTNILSLVGVSGPAHGMVNGVIIVIAVAMDIRTRGRRR